jgi:hypothetical protein
LQGCSSFQGVLCEPRVFFWTSKSFERLSCI